MPIAATRSSVDVRAKPFFQNTGMARRRATSLSNSLGRAIARMMAVLDRIVKNTAIATKVLRARGRRGSLAACWHVDITELRQPFGRGGFAGAEHHNEPSKCLPMAKRYSFNPAIRAQCGRSWWAHFEFTRINIDVITPSTSHRSA